MQIKDRVKELRRVKASELLPNPRNWRKHSPAQAEALRGLLREVGYSDVLLARETADGKLMLIDGHLRQQVTPNMEVPVAVLDVTEQEADILLKRADLAMYRAKATGRNRSELRDPSRAQRYGFA